MEQNHNANVQELNKQSEIIARITKEKDQAIHDTKQKEVELRVSEEKAEKLKAQHKTLRMRLLVWSILLNHRSLHESQLEIVSQMMLESSDAALSQKSKQVKAGDQKHRIKAYLESCKMSF